LVNHPRSNADNNNAALFTMNSRIHRSHLAQWLALTLTHWLQISTDTDHNTSPYLYPRTVSIPHSDLWIIESNQSTTQMLKGCSHVFCLQTALGLCLHPQVRLRLQLLVHLQKHLEFLLQVQNCVPSFKTILICLELGAYLMSDRALVPSFSPYQVALICLRPFWIQHKPLTRDDHRSLPFIHSIVHFTGLHVMWCWLNAGPVLEPPSTVTLVLRKYLQTRRHTKSCHFPCILVVLWCLCPNLFIHSYPHFSV